MIRFLWLLCLLALPASAQTITGVSSLPVKLVLYSAATQGNGADTTEDTLAGYAGTVQFANAGDSLRFVARGVSAGSTDTKSIRLKFGATTMCTATNSAAGNTTWYLDCTVTKSGTNAQSNMAWFNNASNNTVNTQGTTAVTDSGPIAVTVTAQNATTGTANTIQISVGIATFTPAQ